MRKVPLKGNHKRLNEDKKRFRKIKKKKRARYDSSYKRLKS